MCRCTVSMTISMAYKVWMVSAWLLQLVSNMPDRTAGTQPYEKNTCLCLCQSTACELVDTRHAARWTEQQHADCSFPLFMMMLPGPLNAYR
jgi:hypothetical protein